MKIGIISGGDHFIPLAYTLASQGLQVCIFFSPTEDLAAQQKVQAFIQAARLPMQMEKNVTTDVYEWLDAVRPETVFVYGYRYLLDIKRFAGIPAFNIHPGPLPCFRGPSPVFWQLKTGQPTLGFTIHVLSEKFDAGQVVWTKTIPDQPHYTYAAVNQLCSQYCIEGVMGIIAMLRQRMPLPAISAGNKQAGYHKRPQLHDILINWEQMTATEICNLIRACNPWNKGAMTIFNGQELKLMDGALTATHTNTHPGTVIIQDKVMEIVCAGGRTIRTNMLYVYEGYVPAYYADQFGVRHGVKLG
ncbi:methionyl-tRNA formyltransferase [Chitinophaga agri]|uniref:Methionyl-tRNA formyltransferase n=1 Tax=Chitinophaga agri TaxID=2703787 RepID=A0A6B9Z7C8_9BACT|nr:formyltransferase family protein [Chitinophaga agri]QHS58130.1 methionyl-tRNA formyltransferase [Chitinophaga agri]